MKSFKDLFYITSKPIFEKRGLINTKLIKEWEKIVGKDLKDKCWPQRVAFARDKTTEGVLYLEVNNPSYIPEIMGLIDVIIERIASFFGYKAISYIKIKISPVKEF